jgi:hypothetical protein
MAIIGMIGNQNQHQIQKTLKTLTTNPYLINTNLENLRKKKKKNIKNMSLIKTQISMNKIEEHMQDQIYLAKDGNLG